MLERYVEFSIAKLPGEHGKIQVLGLCDNNRVISVPLIHDSNVYPMLILRVVFWPRLIVDEQKPAWLKVNFDRWQSEDASDSENDEQEQQEKLEVNS